jgi:hypothetical protein
MCGTAARRRDRQSGEPDRVVLIAVFDLQGSADLLVEDPDRVVALLVEKLGFPSPEDRWVHDRPNLGYKAVHCRVNRDVATAPTTVEVIGPGRYDLSLDAHNAAYFAMQSGRPVKTHGNVVGTADLDDVRERLDRHHLPYRLLEPGEHLTYPILFPGATADPITYDGSVDGGLYLELIALDAFRIPSVPRDPSCATPGALVRVHARSWLVADLDAALVALAENIGWEPDSPVETVEERNHLRATLRPSLDTSAAIEIVQPRSPDGDVGAFFASYGPGPFAHCLGVYDLHETARALADRGVSHRTIQGHRGRADRVLIDADELDGLRFELIETG